jgi:hypothetical protein
LDDQRQATACKRRTRDDALLDMTDRTSMDTSPEAGLSVPQTINGRLA